MLGRGADSHLHALREAALVQGGVGGAARHLEELIVAMDRDCRLETRVIPVQVNAATGSDKVMMTTPPPSPNPRPQTLLSYWLSAMMMRSSTRAHARRLELHTCLHSNGARASMHGFEPSASIHGCKRTPFATLPSPGSNRFISRAHAHPFFRIDSFHGCACILFLDPRGNGSQRGGFVCRSALGEDFGRQTGKGTACHLRWSEKTRCTAT